MLIAGLEAVARRQRLPVILDTAAARKQRNLHGLCYARLALMLCYGLPVISPLAAEPPS